jgi:hypothetical protein
VLHATAAECVVDGVRLHLARRKWPADDEALSIAFECEAGAAQDYSGTRKIRKNTGRRRYLQHPGVARARPTPMDVGVAGGALGGADEAIGGSLTGSGPCLMAADGWSQRQRKRDERQHGEAARPSNPLAGGTEQHYGKDTPSVSE